MKNIIAGPIFLFELRQCVIFKKESFHFFFQQVYNIYFHHMTQRFNANKKKFLNEMVHKLN